MGLQLRVRHALGARVVEIEPRGPENPIVIGRTPQADVQVPMGTVAPNHCVMYMEGEQWVIQDSGSSTGTFVNGNGISGPVYLEFGDVVSLGEAEGAPVIEIDPMGTARSQMAALERPRRPAKQQPQALYEDRVRREGDVAKKSDWPVAGDEQADQETMVDLGGGARGGYRRRRPVRKQGSYVGITIAAAIGIIVIGWFVVAKVMTEDERPQAGQQAEPPPQDVRAAKGGKNIFEFPEDKPKAKTQGEGAVLPPVAVAPAPDAHVDESPKPAPVETDPQKLTDEWKAVVEANGESERPAKALWTIVDYRRLHPGKFEAELKQYEDAAFDRLWWERINELLDLRKSLESEIEKKNSEIAQETEVAYKQKLQKELEAFLFRKQRAIEALTQEMGYAGKEAANLFDAVQMANLRRQRIPETYEAWKKRVISSLVRTRALPWEQVR
jgi:hypothetical protein